MLHKSIYVNFAWTFRNFFASSCGRSCARLFLGCGKTVEKSVKNYVKNYVGNYGENSKMAIGQKKKIEKRKKEKGTKKGIKEIKTKEKDPFDLSLRARARTGKREKA